MKMKKIIISETQEKILAQLLKEGIYQMPVDKKMNKPYCVNPEKVLIVKKFLDKGFSAHDYEKIGSNGLPCIIKVFSMNASNGEPLKYMYQDQLQDLLIDRFQNMFSDKIERELFMAQVIKDWVAGKIGIFGGLSTNRLLAENMTSEEIDERANDANTNPTDKQKEAGNYAMGHVIVQGMPISIENPKGGFGFLPDLILADGGITQIRAINNGIKNYKNKKIRLKRNYFILILNAVLWFFILTIVVYFLNSLYA